jgi:hypothetical protein
VSAFAKRRQLLRDLLVIIAVPKSSLTSPDADTPIRRPADTLPLESLKTGPGPLVYEEKSISGAHPAAG